VRNRSAQFFIQPTEITMTDETNTTETQAEATPAAAPAKKTRTRSSIAVANDTHKVFTTVEKHSMPFDIQVKGEVIQGTWTREQGYVEFAVPMDLVDSFKLHYHCQVGNVVEDAGE
jgi:hypothetical protein